MPNLFAYLVFYAWPIVVLFFFKKHPYKISILLVIFASQFYLPPRFGFDLPLLPPIDKASLSSLCLVLALYLSKRKLKIFLPGLYSKLLVCYILSTLITSTLNSDSIVYGSLFLPGLTFYDAMSDTIRTFIYLIPLFIGRQFLNEVGDTEKIFIVWVKFALIYSIFMLVEVRLSPQFNQWVYGYGIELFLQQIRDGGFRPVVFFSHGLPLAFIFSLSIIAAGALSKNRVHVYFKSSLVIAYMCLVLLLTKTWSAMFYVMLGLPLIRYIKPNKIVKYCLIASLFVMSYPILKITQTLPESQILEMIGSSNGDRSQSLGYRFEMESKALMHAEQKLFFGWGSWGRSHVYSESGKDLTVLDGFWIIQFSANGVVGFTLMYMILIFPLYKAVTAIKLISDERGKVYFAALCCILTLNIIDSIPNATLININLLLLGALMGQSESIIKSSKSNKFSALNLAT